MKRPDPGMAPGAFRNALRGNPDANKIGARMLLENDPNTYRPGKRKARRTNRKRTQR